MNMYGSILETYFLVDDRVIFFVFNEILLGLLI